MRIVLARLHQRSEIFRHLGPRLVVGRGGAVHKQIIGLHDAVDRGFHRFLLIFRDAGDAGQAGRCASNSAMALLASRSLLNSPCWIIFTMISSKRSSVAEVSGIAPDLRR